jgi:hypothetical protein
VPRPPAPPDPADGTVLLFADALRYDVGQRLARRLRYYGFEVDASWHWSALPSVTPTAKPAVAPLAGALSLASTGTDFVPDLDDGRALTIDRFRARLEERGVQVLRDADTGTPTGRAWTEIGTLDTQGHSEGWKLAWRLDECLGELAARVRQLADAGWRRIEVVTDHGWLVLPGGLPKTGLARFLADSRWGRCATIKPQATTEATEHLTVGWHWNPHQRVALPPGIGVHRKGLAYAHGGLSVQECVVPRLTVRPDASSTPAPAIDDVRWQRLRCRLTVQHPRAGLRADLRTRTTDASSSVALHAKAVREDGTVSLVVPEASRVGEAATVVLLEGDAVVHTHSTTIGSD